MKNYKTVLFDLDGTLTDSGRGITNSVKYSLLKFGIEEKDYEKLKLFVGPPLYESFMKYYGFSKEKSVTAVEYYREYYRDRGIFEFTVYNGVAELLQKLKAAGKTVILATSKPEIFAKKVVDHAELSNYIDIVAGAMLDGSRINKEDVIAYALQKAGVTDNADCIMIGDRCFDVIGAKSLGMDSIGVAYGYGSREELLSAGATFVVESAEATEKILIK